MILRACNVISGLVIFLREEASWSELLPKLFELMRSSSEQLVSSGLHIVGSLAPRDKSALFKNSIPALVSCFDGILGERGNDSVRARAIDAFCNVVQSLTDFVFAYNFNLKPYSAPLNNPTSTPLAT